MATKKAAKKTTRRAGAAKKQAPATKKRARPAAKKATRPPPAKKQRPVKAPGTGQRGGAREASLIVDVGQVLTFQEPPAAPVQYEMVLFVDQNHWTAEQRQAVEAFVAAMNLKLIALGRGWGGP
jgi:hypothetical protein